jgi:hypothetical protein
MNIIDFLVISKVGVELICCFSNSQVQFIVKIGLLLLTTDDEII